MTGIPRIVVGDPDKPGTWDELHPGDGARASGVLIIPPAVLPGHSRPETRQIILDRILDNLANHYDIPPDALMPIILNPVPEGEPVTTPDPFGRDGGNIDEATGEPIVRDTYRDAEDAPTAEDPTPTTVVATEYRYPTYIAVDNDTQASGVTHYVLELTQGGTYRRKVAAAWSADAATQICDALNGYPRRTS